MRLVGTAIASLLLEGPPTHSELALDAPHLRSRSSACFHLFAVQAIPRFHFVVHIVNAYITPSTLYIIHALVPSRFLWRAARYEYKPEHVS